MSSNQYDIAIIGGGIAGLSLSILLAKKNISVILFEKEVYPFHKVCGEYMSAESIPFLKSIGIELDNLELPMIDKIRLTSYAGTSIERLLDIGGTGISRFQLDEKLYKIALNEGVDVRTNAKVSSVEFEQDQFEIQCDGMKFVSKLAVGAYGKNSNIDTKLGRAYKSKNNQDVFIAVKHHIRCDYDKSFVEMHNFDGGYCGMSAIEDGKVNMSYICKASQLKKYGSISEMERQLLSANPFLKKYVDDADFLFPKPLTISHLHFGLKESVSNHILMLGDAAGNIAPLSGNGMSMALRSAKISSQVILDFLSNKISRQELETLYSKHYYRIFHSRILAAKLIHASFGQKHLTNWSFSILKYFPFLIDTFSKQIHGDEF